MIDRSDNRTEPLLLPENALGQQSSSPWKPMDPGVLEDAIQGLKITLPVNLIRELGLEGAAFYHQAAVLSCNSRSADGWFSLRAQGEPDSESSDLLSSLGSWQSGLGIRRDAQKKIRCLLVAGGLLEERRCGVPARLYYRVHPLLYLKYLAFSGQDIQFPECRSLDSEEQPTTVGNDHEQDATPGQERDETAQRPAEDAQSAAPPVPWGLRTLYRLIRWVVRG